MSTTNSKPGSNRPVLINLKMFCLIAVLGLLGCGGGGSGASGPTYSVGGDVAGLIGTLVLQNDSKRGQVS